MQRGILFLLVATVAIALGGCSPNVPNPIAVGPGTLALLLDEEGHYHPWMGKPGEIYLTDGRGSFLQRLLGTENPIGWLRFSPDNSKLLYVSAEEYRQVEGKDYVVVQVWGLRLHDLRTQTESLLVEGKEKISAPSFSPRGERVAYLLEESQTPSFKLHVLDFASRKEAILGTEEGEGYVWGYRWSSDGRGLLMLHSPVEDSADQGEDEKYLRLFAELELWDLMDLDYPGGEGLLYTLAPLWSMDPWPGEGGLDWSPDGRWVALETIAPLFGNDGSPFSQLYLIEFNNELTEIESARLLAEGAHFPAFSPQGDRLAFIGGPELRYLFNRDGEGSSEERCLYLSEPASGEPRRIAGPGMLAGPFWLSEEELGYVEQVDESYKIWVLDLKSGERFDLSAALAARWGGR